MTARERLEWLENLHKNESPVAPQPYDKRHLRKRGRLTAKNYQLPIGSEFGSWTVIGPTVLESEGLRKWPRVPCRCQCGSESKLRFYNLVRSVSQGCNGCRAERLKRAAQ